jgi:hypothetical protein
LLFGRDRHPVALRCGLEEPPAGGALVLVDRALILGRRQRQTGRHRRQTGISVGLSASSKVPSFSIPSLKLSNGQASAAGYWNSKNRRSLPEKLVAEPCTART